MEYAPRAQTQQHSCPDFSLYMTPNTQRHNDTCNADRLSRSRTHLQAVCWSGDKMYICPAYKGHMDHRSQIITLNCLQDPLFSYGEVFAVCSICAWPPDCLQTGHTWADTTTPHALLLLLLPLHTFSAYIAVSALQLFTIFTSLRLSLALNLSPLLSLSVNLSSSGVESLTTWGSSHHTR